MLFPIISCAAKRNVSKVARMKKQVLTHHARGKNELSSTFFTEDGILKLVPYVEVTKEEADIKHKKMYYKA